MQVIFNPDEVSTPMKLPYIQDPANLRANVANRFKPNSFIGFCQRFIDDSSRGFYEKNDYLQIRQNLYNPFNTIFNIGTKISIILVQVEREVMFECLIDPRCSFENLLNINKGPDKYDTPNPIFWYHSRAKFIDHRGVVPNNKLSLLSRGVTFGHYINLVDI